MAATLYEFSHQDTGNCFRTSDLNVLKKITGNGSVVTIEPNSIIGTYPNEIKIIGIAIDLLNNLHDNVPIKDLHIGEPEPFMAQAWIYCLPVNPDQCRLWDEDYWYDI